MNEHHYEVRFAKNQRLPEGYRVMWLDGHYYAENKALNYESSITVNRWHARQWAFNHADDHKRLAAASRLSAPRNAQETE